MKIFTSEQMAAVDRRAIENYGIPSIVLMENAAIATVDSIAENYPAARSAVVVCGTGNNGGDGFAIARHLQQRQLIVTILLAGVPAKLSGDANVNYETCRRMGMTVTAIESEDEIGDTIETCRTADLVIDAMFGTGLSRSVEGYRADLIESLNTLSVPIVAVDLPSGLNGSSPLVDGPAIQADLTVTFAQPKIAHVFAPASECCGSVVVADISIPMEAIEEEGCQLDLITSTEVEPLFETRRPETHKGTYGHVVVIAGSEGRTGAAIMSARSAVRGGAGLVSVVTDSVSANIIDAVSIESMSKTFEMNETSTEAILEFLSGKDAVLIGSGLRDDEESYGLIRALVQRIELPAVIDASGLNAFAGRISELKTDVARILTPHPGELGRLMEKSTAEINRDRIESAREAASRSGAVVILKGHQTLVAAPDGRVSVNPTGNPGMASGGTGDVLGGLLAAILARADDPFEAARAAVFLHGLAGDLLRDRSSDIGLRAMDLAEALPHAVAMLRETAG